MKDNFNLGQVQRYRGTQLEFPCYFTDVQEFLYRGTQVPNPKYAKDETFLGRYRGAKVHSSNSVKDNFNLGQVQRYRGTQLEFPCYIIDLLEFLLKIA